MDRFEQLLLKFWGYSSFRPLQKDIIKSVWEGNDTLALMPTGGGKSITFQVPALEKEGTCLVITPLIALMKDQVENLKAKGIKAIAIFAGMTYKEIDVALDNCVYGDIKFLYVSPERLHTEVFKARIKKININLIAIDEAHCISEWGYDFRPSYLEISKIRLLLPDIPVLALTATATPEVVEDIMDKLEFKERIVFRKSFERKNLIYLVRETEDKLNYLLKIATKAKGSGIVYVRSRKKTKEIAHFLKENQISADFYHAGLTHEQRSEKQNLWKTDQIRVMVSTNAFGMGIDKPNVRFVVHMDLPDSPEAYFQEAGRGGRDEKIAYAVLLFNNSDKVKLEKRIRDAFPEISVIKEVYNALGNHLELPYGAGKDLSFDFSIADFSKKFHFPVLVAHNAIRHLEKEGYIEYTEDVNQASKITFLVNRDDLYKFQLENPKHDGFIKLLLRSYTGLFSGYAVIDELFLAKKYMITPEMVYEFLKFLSKLKIINYIPRKKKPQLIYLIERLEEKNVRISPENYNFRKNRYIHRIDALLKYSQSTTKCRSQSLLHYFGEKNASRCGSCDICQKRNELNISKYKFDLSIEQIKKHLEEKRLSIEELVPLLNENENKSLSIIQWLLDNNKIYKDQENKLKWH